MKKLLLIMLVIFVGCSSNVEVEYSITGTAKSVSVTYESEGGGTSQESEVSLPWKMSFTGMIGDFVYVSAQNQNSTGSVKCTIYKNGSILETSESSGAYVISTASGSI